VAGPPWGAPTDFGKRGILPQKEAAPPLEASLRGVAGPLGMGEVGVCRRLKCWLHYLQCMPHDRVGGDITTRIGQTGMLKLLHMFGNDIDDAYCIQRV